MKTPWRIDTVLSVRKVNKNVNSIRRALSYTEVCKLITIIQGIKLRASKGRAMACMRGIDYFNLQVAPKSQSEAVISGCEP